MHCGPAYLTLGRQPFTVSFCDSASLAKGLRDSLRIFFRELRPFRWACRRIDSNDAILANANLAQNPSDLAGLTDLGQKGFAFIPGPHRGSSPSRVPNWGDQRAHDEVTPRDVIRKAGDVSSA